MIDNLRKSFVNFRGWSTKRKLVLIESDDWGSIRMPNQRTYQKLIDFGLPIDKSRYSKFDSLESPKDLEQLFDTLNSVKDKNSNSACLTANYLVANPDFEAIRKSSFEMYQYEDIFQTYKNYGYQGMRNFIQRGIDQKLFYPQFHGREHLHPQRWMFTVRNCENERKCFDNIAIPGVPINCLPNQSKKFLAALDYYNETEKKFVENALEDGLILFEKLFGYKSKSFIAPQSIRGNHIDVVLRKNGVLFHQNGQQLLPSLENKNNKIVNHYWGHKNEFGMLTWRRNVTFEPSKNQNLDSVSIAMKEIENAFFWGKPAVLNSHRVNFIGSLNEKNQLNSLAKLKELLKKVINKWPDVEFINSQQLGEFMSNTYKKENG